VAAQSNNCVGASAAFWGWVRIRLGGVPQDPLISSRDSNTIHFTFCPAACRREVERHSRRGVQAATRRPDAGKMAADGSMRAQIFARLETHLAKSKHEVKFCI
jgi:hypothetical protein